METNTYYSDYRPTLFRTRYVIGRAVARFGEFIARQGDRISNEACWTGDRETAWGQGYEFARDQLGLDAGRKPAKI
jgi:hypothetical protein